MPVFNKAVSCQLPIECVKFVAEGLFAEGIKLQYSVVLYQHGIIQKDKDIVLAFPQALTKF